MLGAYLPILAMLVLAAIIAVGMVGASFLLGPKRPTKYKADTYESGMRPIGTARERFPVHFYLVAMLFIIFDIETIFLYPWAVAFRDPAIAASQATKLFLLIEMAIFVVILFVGYFYLLGKGAFEWSVDQEMRDEMPDQRIFAPRPPILFGNENSGPAQLVATQEVPNVGRPPSTKEEIIRAPIPFGGGKR